MHTTGKQRARDNLISRSEGYYWLKNRTGKSILGLFRGDLWHLCGNACSFRDHEFLSIGPRIKEQDELIADLTEAQAEITRLTEALAALEAPQ